MLGFPLAKIMRLRHGRSAARDHSAASIAVPQRADYDATAGARAGQGCEAVEIRGALVGLAVRHALGLLGGGA